jgi:hypothetical protein
MKIVQYDEFTAQIEALRNEANFIPDGTTEEGYQKSKEVSKKVIGKVLTRLEKVRKEEKSESLERGREIDAQAKEIKAVLLEIQAPHKELYETIDNAKKEAEAKRKADLEERVRYIKELPEAMADMDSESIIIALQEIQAEECLDFYEFTEHALKAKNASCDALAKLHADKMTSEREAKELEELRAKQSKQDELDRQAAAVKAATEKAEREKFEAIEREEAAKEAAKKAEQDTINAKAQAEDQAIKAAEQARLDEVARQEAVEAEKARQEQDRLANVEHCRNFNAQAFIDLQAFAGISEDQAKSVVVAIARNQISNITINY